MSWIISNTQPHRMLSGKVLKHRSWALYFASRFFCQLGLGWLALFLIKKNFPCTNQAPFENDVGDMLRISNFKHFEPRWQSQGRDSVSGHHSTLFFGVSLSKTTISPWLAYEGLEGFSSCWVGETNVGHGDGNIWEESCYLMLDPSVFSIFFSLFVSVSDQDAFGSLFD